MITLYHSSKSCSVAVKAALVAANIEHEIKTIDLSQGEQFSAEYIKINPLSKVPALKVNDNIITEGAAILLHISDQAPQAKLLPNIGSVERVQALQWLQFMYGNVHSPYSRLFMPTRYAENEDDVKAKAEQELNKIFTRIDEQLNKNDFIACDQLSLADFYLLVAIYWEFVLQTPLTETFSNVATYKQRMLEVPFIKEVYGEEYGY
jgi:glutathione S-transferase